MKKIAMLQGSENQSLVNKRMVLFLVVFLLSDLEPRQVLDLFQCTLKEKRLRPQRNHIYEPYSMTRLLSILRYLKTTLLRPHSHI